MLFVTHSDNNLDGFCAAAAGMADCHERGIPSDVLITSKRKVARDLARLLLALGRETEEVRRIADIHTATGVFPTPNPLLPLLPALTPAKPVAKTRPKAATPDIIVCGVAPEEFPEDLAQMLDALTAAGHPVRWFLPYYESTPNEVPESVKKQAALLDGHCACEPVPNQDKSQRCRLFRGMVRALGLEKSKRVKLLRDVLALSAPAAPKPASAPIPPVASANGLTAKNYYRLAQWAQQRYFLYGEHDASPDLIRKLAGTIPPTAEDHDSNKALCGKFCRTFSGKSDVIKKLREQLGRLRNTEAKVMILGESGSGKDIAAEAIHYGSRRADKPFLAVNCAEFINESLLTAQIFGYKKGAFTGADKDTPGLVEKANGGTLFLDEIGEMPLSCQALLLRFLQNHKYHRMNEDGEEEREANVRVICATNRDLAEEVRNGRFRADLFFRLKEAVVRVPPLRDRPEDIAELAYERLKRVWSDNLWPDGAVKLSDAQAAILQGYDWPGNIRQLHGVIADAVYRSLPEGGMPAKGMSPEAREAFRKTLAANLAVVLEEERQLGIAPRSGGEAAPLPHASTKAVVVPEPAPTAPVAPAANSSAAPEAAPATPPDASATPGVISIYVDDPAAPGGRRLKNKNEMLTDYARLAVKICGNNSRAQKATGISENTFRDYLHPEKRTTKATPAKPAPKAPAPRKK